MKIIILSCKEKKNICFPFLFKTHSKSKLLIHRGMSYRGANICSDNNSMLLWLFINENESNIRFKKRKRFGHYSYSVILLLFIIMYFLYPKWNISLYWVNSIIIALNCHCQIAHPLRLLSHHRWEHQHWEVLQWLFMMAVTVKAELNTSAGWWMPWITASYYYS